MPWRKTTDPYRITVSEVMLQQTQVNRVRDKYLEFIKRYPDFLSLSKANNRDVLLVWQGLGYNRRAIYLRDLARIIVGEYGNKLPRELMLLKALPGIGTATAGAILSYAFNQPSVFIETNIRRVFIHFFFPNGSAVDDKGIMPLVSRTLDMDNPREWYWALADYGAMLGKTRDNPNRKSRHYAKQSAFTGSDRKLRGEIVRILLVHGALAIAEIAKKCGEQTCRVENIVKGLEGDGLVRRQNGSVSIG